MKNIQIFKRQVLERTGLKRHPYKESIQITILYDGRTIENHLEDIHNPRLKIKFNQVLNTRSAKELDAFAKTLSRTDADKWLKQQIEQILKA